MNKKLMSKAAIRKKRRELSRRRNMKTNFSTWRYLHPRLIETCSHGDGWESRYNAAMYEPRILLAECFFSIADFCCNEMAAQSVIDCMVFRRVNRCVHAVSRGRLSTHEELENGTPPAIRDMMEYRFNVVLTDKEIADLNALFGPVDINNLHEFICGPPCEQSDDKLLNTG